MGEIERMAIRLGVLGADDSIAVIQQVAREFSEIEIVPIVYWEEEEVLDKARPFLTKVDMWLCSGQVPYTIMVQRLDLDHPIFYTRHSGEGLYKVLLYWVHERGMKISDMSFDTLSPDTMQQLLQGVGIQTPFHLKHYSGEIHSKELVQFHRSLWESGITKVAVTCLRSAQLQLAKLGIPSTHITPTVSEVRQVLDSVVQTYELLQSRDAQLVVQMLQQVGNSKNQKTPVDELDTAIHRYARYLHGTKQQVSSNCWTVFATRGAVENVTENFAKKPCLGSIANVDDGEVVGGIGIGKTVREAEDRARFALSQAKICGLGSWACAFDDNSVIAPLGETDRTLSYTYVREDLQRLSSDVALSALTLTKISSILEKRNSTTITAYELAGFLHVLPRSARRILLKLEEYGLATVIGEETPYQRGRPRKIYDIHLDKDSP